MINEIRRLGNGLSNRQMFNIFGGMFLGAVAPVVYARYAIFNNLNGEPYQEINAWVISTVTTALAFPLNVYSITLGTAVGMTSAVFLDAEQRNKQNKLEEIIE
ncbi:hypothetical protein J4440_06390 [Candidatus Woesearchaeota archaeon]|nr:hypothetical protein [Candidatus Woesearchaeota archaeon]